MNCHSALDAESRPSIDVDSCSFDFAQDRFRRNDTHQLSRDKPLVIESVPLSSPHPIFTSLIRKWFHKLCDFAHAEDNFPLLTSVSLCPL